MARDEITRMAQTLCRKHPDASARTLARRLVKETKGAITIDSARSRIRRQFGVAGKKMRRVIKAAAPRKPRKAGVAAVLPPTKVEPWGPYRMDALGPVGIISDVHVPYHSPMAVTAAVAFLKKQKLSGLLLNGDIADFYSISRFTKDPRKRDFKGELDAVRQFVGFLREQWPKIPIVYKCGNHEERFSAWLFTHAAEISDDERMSLRSWLELDKHGITLVDEQRPVMLGKLPVLHGHELQRGIAAPVNVARGAFLRTLSTCLVGHSHRTSNHAESDMWHRETATWSTGCLCDLRPEYSRFARYNHGFAIATVYEDGAFDVNNYRVMSDGSVRC